MNDKFNLSDKEIDMGNDNLIYRDDDIKEFIRLLKEEVRNDKFMSVDMLLLEPKDIDEIINRLVGEKLNGL